MSFQVARDLFLQNKYEESLSMLKAFLHQSNQENEQIEILELLLKIKKILKLKENFDDYSIHYGVLLNRVGRHAEAQAILWPLLILKNYKNQNHLVALWNSLTELGELARAEQVARLNLYYLLKKKNITKLKHFIATLNEHGYKDEFVQSYLYHAGIIQGDLRPMEAFLEREVTIQKIKAQNIALLKKIDELIHAMDAQPYWDKQYIKKYFILLSLLLGKKSLRGARAEKKFVSNLFEYITLGGKVDRVVGLLALYSLKVKRKNVAKFVVDYKSPQNNPSKELVELIGFLKEEIAHYSSDYKSLESADYGTDLLRVDNLGQRSLDAKVKQLEFEIKLLIENNKHVQALELMREISTLDSEHTYAKEYYEQKESKIGSTIARSRKEMLSSIEKLQAELTYLSRTTLDNEVDDFIAQRALQKSIDLMTVDELKKNGRDIIVALMSLSFFDAALWVLEKSESDLGITFLEHVYLKLTAYYDLRRFHQVNDEVNELVKSYPLLVDELHCFLYIKAEALRELGRRFDAQNIYKKIYKENPNYRMVSQRLSEFG